MITLTVFYRKGNFKRGSPATNATFLVVQQDKLAFGFPGVTQLLPLPISNQSNNVYRLSPSTAPLLGFTERFTIRVIAPDRGSSRGGEEDVAINQGESLEVWVGNER